ncbi:MAG: tRNA lysidine(34) synthetase TilS [Candidatus Omnitrophica bacterium]|nr:tRNA lysidine(34) synthetase TilS [Candidatus Omnitrophota bacterium]
MLQNKILDTIRKFNLLSTGDKVLIGVSGGPDSVALLYLLNELSIKLGIKIIVAHLNHGIRGKSADSDEKFVRNITSGLCLDFFSKRIHWSRAKLYYPNEEMLRKLRYDFLFDAAKKYRVNKIALAHTLDDQAETVLMRLIRGTGLYGLISILPKRKIKSFVVIRPMIEITREGIETYLKKIKVKPRIDKTNFSKSFLRNRIRYGLLKDLGKINPNIKQILGRFAQQAAIDYDYLYQKSKRFLKLRTNSLIKVELEKFRNLHIALQRMVIRVALEKISGELRTFTNKHWEEIQDLMGKRPSGSIVYLTKKIRVKKDKKHIIIYA